MMDEKIGIALSKKEVEELAGEHWPIQLDIRNHYQDAKKGYMCIEYKNKLKAHCKIEITVDRDCLIIGKSIPI